MTDDYDLGRSIDEAVREAVAERDARIAALEARLALERGLAEACERNHANLGRQLGDAGRRIAELEARLAALPLPAPNVAKEGPSAPPVVDPTNHHNAMLCPYCNPKRLRWEDPAARAGVPDREALARAIAAEIVRQGGETDILGEDLKLEYLDQGEVDFGLVADAALAALPLPAPNVAKEGPSLAERVDELEAALAEAEKERDAANERANELYENPAIVTEETKQYVVTLREKWLAGVKEGVELRARIAELEARLAALPLPAPNVAKEGPLPPLGVKLFAALRRLVDALADADDEGLIEHAEPMAAARAALAAADRAVLNGFVSAAISAANAENAGKVDPKEI